MSGARNLVEVMSRAKDVLDAAAVARILRFLESKRADNGGFRGKVGEESDAYYTFFGLASAAALADESPHCPGKAFWRNIGDRFREFDLGHLRSIAGLWALCSKDIDGGIQADIAGHSAEFAAADGGFHHFERGAKHSTPYGIFLAEEIRADIGMSEALPEEGAAALLERGAVPTVTTMAAAALAVLARARRAESAKALEIVRFLNDLEMDKGGFAAAHGAPRPDILSSSSAIYALALAGRPVGHVDEHMEFIESAWDEQSGGFAESAALDAKADCEYTFHALLALGHLAQW